MKTRRHIFGGLVLAAAALVCLTGCKKDDEGEKITLGVDFEQTAGMQKTYIGNEDKTIYWSTDDNVQVNGTNYLVHDGVVEVKLSDDGYAAVYPKTATLNGTGKTCTGGTVVIPATQTYTAVDGVQRLDGPMAARLDSKTGRLLFRNLYAVVKVTVRAKSDAPFTLNSITVESTNGVNLAGTQEFTFGAATNTAAPTLGTLTTTSKSVTLTGISITIPAGGKDSFYLYTVQFSGADLNVRVNGRVENRTPARNGIAISRSQLRGTTVDVSNLEPMRFSVAEGKYVTFSPGNLQWSATGTGTWRFAEHQWDYIGNAAGNTTASNRDKQSDWIDLFGWGTSGWNNRNKCYQPYDTSNATKGEYADSKGYGYGPTDGTNYKISLSDENYKNADWGVYNAIYNPQTGLTDLKGTWRTLTDDEWTYLLGTGTDARGGGVNSTRWIYNMVKITDVGSAGVTGLIIYPDGVTAADLSGFTSKANFSQNSRTAAEITKADFGKLEAMGCVFLPAAGSRNGTSVSDAGSYGYYWSSTCRYSYLAYYLRFYSGRVNPGCSIGRYYGYSVRLVKDVK